MSTIQQLPPLPPTQDVPATDDDPYRYGWRYVKSVKPDGTVDYDQVPLTLEDLLFPEEGDFVVQADSHRRDWVFLSLVFDAQLSGDPSAVVLADCRVDFNLPGVRPLGPDVVVILGVDRHNDWTTLDLAEEGARPALVVEVVSPDTRPNDFGIKKDFYFRAGVPLYIIVDWKEVDGRRKVILLGHRWTPGGYEPMTPNPQGRLWLAPVRVWLGTAESVYGERVACFEESGREIGEYDDLVRERLEAIDRAERAEARVEQAEVKAEQAEARAEQAEAKAAQEARAREDLERRLQAMEAELRRVKGNSERA